MRITMKTLFASEAGALQPGQTADVAPKLGKELIEKGYATEGTEEREPEDTNALNAKRGRARGSGRAPTGKAGKGSAGGDSTGDGGDGGSTGDGDTSGDGTGGDGQGDGGDGSGGDGESGGDETKTGGADGGKD